jgi:hypothetical protein
VAAAVLTVGKDKIVLCKTVKATYPRPTLVVSPLRINVAIVCEALLKEVAIVISISHLCCLIYEGKISGT